MFLKVVFVPLLWAQCPTSSWLSPEAAWGQPWVFVCRQSCHLQQQASPAPAANINIILKLHFQGGLKNGYPFDKILYLFKKNFILYQFTTSLILIGISELGTSLFENAQSLFALERTFILGAMVLLETKSEAQWANWQNKILCGPLMSDIRIKERRKNGSKRHKNARFIHI